MNLIETYPTIRGRKLYVALVNEYSLHLLIREVKIRKGRQSYKTLLYLEFANNVEIENEEYQKFLTQEGFLDTDFPDIDINIIQKYGLFLDNLRGKRKVLAIELLTKIQNEFKQMFSWMPDNIEKNFNLNATTYQDSINYAQISFRIEVLENGDGAYCDILVGDRTDLRLNNKIFYDMLPQILDSINIENIKKLIWRKIDFDKQTETIFDMSYDLYKTSLGII